MRQVALVTGGAVRVGRAITMGLAEAGYDMVVNYHDSGTAAADVVRRVEAMGRRAVAVRADVSHEGDVADLVGDAEELFGRLDLLVNNASTLGPSPLPALADVDEAALADVYRTNAIAPLLLFQAVVAALEESGGTMIAITSDAAGGPWPGWGVYGSSKAALEQLVRVLGAEHPGVAVYAVDPGDLRTDMHQAAFPGEDISDRPEPATVVPAVLSLLDARPPSGRYRAAELTAVEAGGR